jgi:hypothetical protein
VLGLVFIFWAASPFLILGYYEPRSTLQMAADFGHETGVIGRPVTWDKSCEES